jgi:ribosomal protein S18 acetylase RimI-like enzyme
MAKTRLNVKIRNATGKDIGRIAVLVNKFVNEVPAWGLVARTEDDLKRLDTRLLWVVEEQNKLVGYAICLPRANDGSCIYSERDKILEIDEIYLVSESRNKGIGSQLLQIIENYGRAQGYTKLFIYSSVQDIDSSLKFYRGSGFKTWAVQLFKEID